jgi:hypothetical protein
MPFEARWLDEQPIIYVALSGSLTEEELTALVDTTISLAGSVPDRRVHTLMNATGLTNVPRLDVVSRAIRRVNESSPNRDMTAVYGLSKVMRYILELLLRMTPLRYKAFDSREGAERFLQEVLDRDARIAAIQGQNQGGDSR